MIKYTEHQLQKAIDHARREPTVPRPRIAPLYEVNHTTLSRRIAGTQRNLAAAHREAQLFSTGDERAIASFCGVMADHSFSVSDGMLKKIAQAMLSSRKPPPKGKGKASISAGTGSEVPDDPEVHLIGVHWVKRFLRRNSGFKKQYVCYQERA